MKIEVIRGEERTVLQGKHGDNLLALLRENGYELAAECGGRGVCGKCRVKAVNGIAGGENGYVLACDTVPEGDCAIELPQREYTGGEENETGVFSAADEEGYGVAVDIGTTTLIFSLVNLKNGRTEKTVSLLNPQRAFGADVISRIQSADEGHLHEMCVSVRKAIGDFLRQCGVSVKRTIVAGNPTMLHLFMNREAGSLGRYPFTPLFTDTLFLSGNDVDIPSEEVIVLPSVGSFVGADVVAGAVALDLESGNNLLVDMGTNGELFLCFGGKFLSASTAVGPCFEGANIECGTVAVRGAINKVYWENGRVCHTVIGGAEPTGICGAALVDAVAVMLAHGIIDESGRFSNGENKFYISDTVYVSQADVRAFQLAKSAVCAGIKCLLSEAGITGDEIDNLYIAGGLGFYLDIGNAVRVGLIPKDLGSKARAVGNTSLSGAKICLLSAEKVAAAQSLSRRTQYLDLSASAEFMNEYVSNMGFEG